MTAGESKSRAQKREALKVMACGLALTVAAIWFWLYLVGNPIHDLRLMLYGRTTPGHIIDAWEDVNDGSKGEAYWSHGAAYTYRLPDGRELKGRTGSRPGRLGTELTSLDKPISVEVEYDPDDPSLSRIKGSGSQSITEWLLRKVGLGAFLLFLLLLPGGTLIRTGLRGLRASGTSGYPAEA